MPFPATKIPSEFISTLNMNGLRGRMLRLPSKKKSEFLFVYGHHSSLERVYGFAQALNDYGNVTIPDLPGFGGMDSFYKIKEKPDLDTLASYLASFIKMRYRNKQFNIIGYSFGFLVVTRMLQLYPELQNKVKMVVSIAGFVKYDDFVFTKTRRRMYLLGARFFGLYFPSLFFRNIMIHPIVIRKFYKRTHNAREKFEGLDPEMAKAMTEFEVHLWRCNEARTYMRTSSELFTVDNTKSKIGLKVWHVSVENDKYFDNTRAIKHLKQVYKSVDVIKANSKKHSPSIIASKQEAMVFFPAKIRRAFSAN